jgi:hypothetical protein
MSDFLRDNPVLRGALYALGSVALVGLFVWLCRPSARSSAPVAASAALSAPADHPTARVPPKNERMILAECHPELSANTTSPPTFEVSPRIRPWAATLKVRFWVNNDGFVTKAFILGGTVDRPEDQEAALRYIKGPTFQLPNTDECRSREIEIVGDFRRTADSNGDYVTVLDIHPQYAYQDGRLVEYH